MRNALGGTGVLKQYFDVGIGLLQQREEVFVVAVVLLYLRKGDLYLARVVWVVKINNL